MTADQKFGLDIQALLKFKFQKLKLKIRIFCIVSVLFIILTFFL
jgi:hypothetical protein